MNGNPLLLPTAVLGAILFCCGIPLHHRFPRLALSLGVLVSFPCLLAILYYAHVFDSWIGYYELRSLPLTELSFAGVGFLGGCLHNWHRPITWRERLTFPLLAFGVLLIPFMKPLLDPLDISSLQDRCKGEVCLQSSLSTCGPASAASIARSLGQQITEQQLASESFSYKGGTEIWYLARALRKRGYTVQFISVNSGPLPYPAIAGVRLAGGAGHFIAILRVADQSVTLVDPMKGEATLSLQRLREMYTFTGVFLRIQAPPVKH